MTTDAVLNAGLITEIQARKCRADVAVETDSYRSVDGASKYVKGGAITGLIIIESFVGGIVIGVREHNVGNSR